MHATGKSIAIERGVGAHQLFERYAGTAEDDGQVRTRALRQFQFDAGMGEAGGETLGAEAVEQIDRRHVERQAQGIAGRHRPVEARIEIDRPVVAEGLRSIDEQAFRMDQAVVHRECVEKRFQGRARRSRRAHHVDMAQALLLREGQRADIGLGFERAIVDHQQGRRTALRQSREIFAHALFQHLLQVGIDAAADPAAAGVGATQAIGQQGRQHRRLQASRDDGLDARFLHFALRPDALRGQSPEHLVARGLRQRRIAIGPQAARRLRQHGQHRRFGMRKTLRRFSEIGPTGRFHALDRAAEGRAIQVQREDLALRAMPFQLQCAQHLAQLARGGARVRIQDAGDLHAQGRAAGNNASVTGPLRTRTQHRHRIHAGMTPEPAIFVADQRLQVERRNVLGLDRIAPDAVGAGEGAQGPAVACGDDDAGRLLLRQGQGKQPVQREQRQQAQRSDDGRMRQPASPPPPRGRIRHHGLRAGPP